MQKLCPRNVEKPWGRSSLAGMFASDGITQIGEVWYENPGGQDLPLLVKYIFTSERLSIQVHPDDAQARAKGLPGGKEEIWYILDCEPGATLGIGLIRPLSPDEFAKAAEDGSLEQLIDWKPVQSGDCYFIPAGTVHAIGAGIILAEIQQNVDVTYRLYDYGRPRPLHLDDGLPVSHLVPYDRGVTQAPLGTNAHLISSVDAPFSLDLVHWEDDAAVHLPDAEQIWFTPLVGSGTADGVAWEKGDCLLLDGRCVLTLDSPVSALLAVVAQGLP